MSDPPGEEAAMPRERGVEEDRPARDGGEGD